MDAIKRVLPTHTDSEKKIRNRGLVIFSALVSFCVCVVYAERWSLAVRYISSQSCCRGARRHQEQEDWDRRGQRGILLMYSRVSLLSLLLCFLSPRSRHLPHFALHLSTCVCLGSSTHFAALNSVLPLVLGGDGTGVFESVSSSFFFVWPAWDNCTFSSWGGDHQMNFEFELCCFCFSLSLFDSTASRHARNAGRTGPARLGHGQAQRRGAGPQVRLRRGLLQWRTLVVAENQTENLVTFRRALLVQLGQGMTN